MSTGICPLTGHPKTLPHANSSLNRKRTGQPKEISLRSQSLGRIKHPVSWTHSRTFDSPVDIAHFGVHSSALRFAAREPAAARKKGSFLLLTHPSQLTRRGGLRFQGGLSVAPTGAGLSWAGYVLVLKTTCGSCHRTFRGPRRVALSPWSGPFFRCFRSARERN